MTEGNAMAEIPGIILPKEETGAPILSGTVCCVSQEGPDRPPGCRERLLLSNTSLAASPSPPSYRHCRRTAKSPPSSRHRGRTAESPPSYRHCRRTAKSPPSSRHKGRTADSPPSSRYRGRTADSPPSSRQRGRTGTGSPPSSRQRGRTGSPPSSRQRGRTGTDSPVGCRRRRYSGAANRQSEETPPPELPADPASATKGNGGCAVHTDVNYGMCHGKSIFPDHLGFLKFYPGPITY